MPKVAELFFTPVGGLTLKICLTYLFGLRPKARLPLKFGAYIREAEICLGGLTLEIDLELQIGLALLIGPKLEFRFFVKLALHSRRRHYAATSPQLNVALNRFKH